MIRMNDDAAAIENFVQVILSIVMTSIQIRSGSADSMVPFNADFAILLTLPHLVRMLKDCGYDVDELCDAVDTMITTTFLNPVVQERGGFKDMDLVIARTALDAVGEQCV